MGPGVDEKQASLPHLRRRHPFRADDPVGPGDKNQILGITHPAHETHRAVGDARRGRAGGGRDRCLTGTGLGGGKQGEGRGSEQNW